MWSLTGSIAQLRVAGLQAQLDVRRPRRGLHAIAVRIAGEWTPVVALPQLLQLTLAGREGGADRLLDSYVRTVDLVATYAPHAGHDVQSQVYWRGLECPAASAWGVELLLSVQTDLLNSDPSSVIATDVSAQEIWTTRGDDAWERCDLRPPAAPGQEVAARHGSFLFRLAEIPVSYLEMVHPSDLDRATISLASDDGSRAKSSLRLFPDAMEKGVIRRGRVRGLFLPRADDLLAATALRREFVAAEPPLTT